jgi:alanyl-tRNA synthetase
LMKASEIRRSFLDYFGERGHERVHSAPLVPANDPTLLFTNSGMVQFKQVFVGTEEVPYRRAVTAQKCVRAGGKHNDLEEVGRTARHHTFFEMLGNFSFGDYFKEDAIRFAWEFLTKELGIDPDRLYVTVHHTDDEAFELWQRVAGVAASRIHRLGDRDNFWQMADTGPCGPCSELHYDARPGDDRPEPDTEEFEALGERGVFIELWNLVFMQYDRAPDGELTPLPAPSIDTGAGLERIAAVLQGVDSNYDTDLFGPLLQQVGETVGRPYDADGPEGLSFRVLADHARAVAFLLADGVFPSNEGRGYVLRRILRRGVRHAWLLGRREPTLVEVVDAVIDQMGEAYPELPEARSTILRSTRREEERFLETIEGGMARMDELAPADPPDAEGPQDAAGDRVISGAEAFRLYDTFGFPLDLTQLIARERGYRVDTAGFEEALAEQRARSRADRAAGGEGDASMETLGEWTLLDPEATQEWVGWDSTRVDTQVIGLREAEGRVGMILRENPFYAAAGGQVADVGSVQGTDWNLQVDDVRVVEGRQVVYGVLEGDLPRVGDPFEATALVAPRPRHDTERHHTATHLLHSALREVLGEHVRQRGSLVAPDRLRFDFSHTAPLTPEELNAVEGKVNQAIWADLPVRWEIMERERAMEKGAMALFGEKYGEEVRVVEIPGVSLELCGGTHLRHTGEAAPFVITRESGVAAGVRRIEALTGPHAVGHFQELGIELSSAASLLRAAPMGVAKRVEELLQEKRELEALLQELRKGGGGAEQVVHEARIALPDGSLVSYEAKRIKVRDAGDARDLGDRFREEASSAVSVVASETPDGKNALFVFVTDDLLPKGVRAGDLVKEVAAVVGGRGGGRPHMAQGGVENPGELDRALAEGEKSLRRILGSDE